MVVEPRTKRLAGSRETSVPSSVRPGAPGVRVVPAIVMRSGAAVMVWPPIVVVVGDAESRRMVFEPITSWLAVFKDINVPSIVIPGAIGIRVVPATMTAFGAAVTAWPPMEVVIVCGDSWAKGMVLEPTINWPAVSRDIVVPSIVAPGSPGLKVLPAMTTAFGAAVIAWPAIVLTMGFTTGYTGGLECASSPESPSLSLPCRELLSLVSPFGLGSTPCPEYPL